MRSAIRILCIFAMLWVFAATTYDRQLIWPCAIAFLPAAALFGWSFGNAIPNRTGIDRRHAWRIVRRWSIAEGVAIFVAVAVLSALHAPVYSMPAVIAILGLHFIPLAVQLAQRLYFGTAMGCLAVAAFAASAPTITHIALAALATSIILTFSAIALAAISRRSGLA
jgi:hypothetical protein